MRSSTTSWSVPAVRRSRTNGLLLLATVLVLMLIAPMLVYPLFLIKILCFVLFAAAFNLVLGYAGLLSFGHAAFFGGAAYIAAHAAKVWHLPFELAVLAGTAFAAVLGLIFGALAIRRHGIYFAMITLALAQMVYFPQCKCHSRAEKTASRPCRAAFFSVWSTCIISPQCTTPC
jgi:branched-chain amino acid transport system permease protein